MVGHVHANERSPGDAQDLMRMNLLIDIRDALPRSGSDPDRPRKGRQNRADRGRPLLREAHTKAGSWSWTRTTIAFTSVTQTRSWWRSRNF